MTFRNVALTIGGCALAGVCLCLGLLGLIIIRDMIVYGGSRQQQELRQPVGGSTDPGAVLADQHSCYACHGPDLAGRQLGDLYAPDISAQGVTGTWSEADFIRAMRTGTRPDGSVIRPPMPWESIGALSDAELSALWQYLRTVRAEPTPTP